MSKLLIFEDEPAALQRLTRIISEIRPHYEIVDTADNISDAFYLLTNADFDLILSDIELSDGTCFEVFEKTNLEKPIIFITAYNDYAIKAFEFNGIHYLLKPINYEALTQAFVKFEKNKITSAKINTLQLNASAEIDFQKRFISKIGNKLKVVETEAILLFYTDTGLVYAKTLDNKKYVLDFTLEKIYQKVDSNIFFRINRQMIVNIDAIIDMQSYTSNRLKLKLKVAHHEEVVVSKEKSSDFKTWVASH
jgi:DNA-binding LytR/AlgR family response regulator